MTVYVFLQSESEFSISIVDDFFLISFFTLTLTHCVYYLLSAVINSHFLLQYFTRLSCFSLFILFSAGDVIVYINDVCVLGTTHADVVKLFQSVPIGQSVTLVLCRGYPLPYDPEEAANTNNNTTTTIMSPLGIMEQRPIMVNGRAGYDNYLDYLSRTARFVTDPSQDQVNAQQLLPPHPGDTHLDGSLPPTTGTTPPDSVSMASSGATQGEMLTLTMVKGMDGFGFTIADSATGQRVKQVLEPLGCPGLCEGDLIVEINKQPVQGFTHTQVVELLKECAVGAETSLVVQRGGTGKSLQIGIV